MMIRSISGSNMRIAIYSLVFLLLWLPIALYAAPQGSAADSKPAVGPDYYEIVYADANIGASSGGHSALKLRNTIYHYQMYADGIFRLVREDWSDFRRLYNDHENRTLGIRRVRLTPGKIRKLEDVFALRYLVQLRHLDIFTDLREQRKLFETFAVQPVPSVPIPGYGMFQTITDDATSDSESDGGPELRQFISNRSGEDLSQTLRRRRNFIYARLRATLAKEISRPLPDAFEIESGEVIINPQLAAQLYAEQRAIFHPDRLPRALELFSQSVREDLAELAALRVLDEARPLVAAMLFDSYSGDAPAIAALTPVERTALELYRAQLADEIATQLTGSPESPAPDRGATLLLNQARYRAITLSLKRNRLLTLDPFPARRVRVSAATVQRDRAIVHRLAARAGESARRTRNFVFGARGGLNETRYNRLEEDAGRYYEILRGATEPGRSIRAARSPMIPGTAFPASIEMPLESLPAQWTPFIENDGLNRRLQIVRDRETRYLERLRQGYDYHLIRKNCVTELLRTIEAGGGVPAGATFQHRLRFIPFVAFDLFEQKTARYGLDDNDAPSRETAAYNNIKNRIEGQADSKNLRWLPSYRKRRLAKIVEREGLMARPRESFATNSTIYTPRAKDSAFLMFTDDIFWARPLYGMVNVVYGLGYAGTGLFSAPFDRGARIEAGLRGTLFSLPEFVWFNIRKGSFDYVPEESTGSLDSTPGSDAPAAAVD